MSSSSKPQDEFPLPDSWACAECTRQMVEERDRADSPMTPTETTTLADFLLARIAEDEAVARAAADAEPGRWNVQEIDHEGIDVWGARDGVGGKVTFENSEVEPVLRHIARHDPARVLAECGAKRRVVELHGPDRPYCDLNWSNANHDFFEGDCDTLKLLALPYVDHPDYREEWKP